MFVYPYFFSEIDLVASTNGISNEVLNNSVSSEGNIQPNLCSESHVLSQEDLNPMFIVVQVLERGQHFVSYLFFAIKQIK